MGMFSPTFTIAEAIEILDKKINMFEVLNIEDPSDKYKAAIMALNIVRTEMLATYQSNVRYL